jgi:D-cysteine desulfhydrase
MSQVSPDRPRTEPPIFEIAPRLARLPFCPIAHGPTPVHPLAGYGERVWVKRDDLVSPIYGGNKVRRWEWLLADARARGKSHVFTVGGLGSTQVTSLTMHGEALGFRVSVVLFDQPHTAFVDEALACDEAHGAHVALGHGYARTAALSVREILRERPYVIAPGASGPLANLAYVDAALELGRQVAAGLAPRPDAIVVACGSGGTAVGLAIGMRLLGWDTEVVAVRITDLAVSNPATLKLAELATLRRLEREGARIPGRTRARIRMEHRFVGEGYGFATPEAERGAAKYGELFGVPGEVTYSGKALAALDRLVAEDAGRTLLFWTTLSTTGRARSSEPTVPLF